MNKAEAKKAFEEFLNKNFQEGDTITIMPMGNATFMAMICVG